MTSSKPTLFLVFRSSVFFIGMVLATLIHSLLSLCTFPLPYHMRYRFIILWCRFVLFWLKITCGIKHKVIGAENIPRHNAIILSKHQSAWETFSLQVMFPYQTTILKKELLRVPFFGWALALLEPIAIDRKQPGHAGQQIISQGKQRLKDGRWILIFPEGTRTPPGTQRRFTRGGATLAATSGYPVLPIAHNAGDYWPRRGFIKYPGTIKLIIGPLVTTKDKDADTINAEVKAWMDQTMQQYFGYY